MRGSVKRGAIKSGVGMLLLLASAGVMAFGATAHLIVGAIAEENLCPAAREVIEPLLDGYSLGEAGLWADKIRGYSQWDYAKPWHYINVPDGVAIADAKRRPEGDVLFAIGAMENRLDDPALDNKEHAQALRFLVHFVADIHQPLHVGRRADLGGNKVKVSYEPVAGNRWKKSNLHKYWDSAALNMAVENPPAYAAELMATRKLTGEPDLADWQPGKPADWAAESMEFRSEVYDFPPADRGAPVRLDAAYRARTLEILDQRLLLAGLRLAATLNQHYCAAGGVEAAGTDSHK
jgi:hypothetical protein